MTGAAVTMDLHPQPAPGQAKPWAFPVPERRALGNGLTVLRCHRPGQQVVAVQICLDMPLDAEPDGLDGIAAIMMNALAEGTSKHTGEEFAAEMERCGATLDTSTDYPGARVSLEVHVSRLPKALGLLAEALHAPTTDRAVVAGGTGAAGAGLLTGVLAGDRSKVAFVVDPHPVAASLPGLAAPSQRASCQSTQANTSTGVTAASRRPCPIKNLARITTSNA